MKRSEITVQLWTTAGGTYSAPPDLLVGFKGPTSKGIGGEREGRGQRREGKEGDGKGRGLRV